MSLEAAVQDSSFQWEHRADELVPTFCVCL